MVDKDNGKFISPKDEAIPGDRDRMTGGEVPHAGISSRETRPGTADDWAIVHKSGVEMSSDHWGGEARVSSSDWAARPSGDEFNPRIAWRILRLGLCLVMGIAYATANGPSSRRSSYPSPGSAAYTQQAVRDYARFQQHLADHPEIVRNIQEQQQQLIQREKSRIKIQDTNVSRGESGTGLSAGAESGIEDTSVNPNSIR
jgi:hypothetical protein